MSRIYKVMTLGLVMFVGGVSPMTRSLTDQVRSFAVQFMAMETIMAQLNAILASRTMTAELHGSHVVVRDADGQKVLKFNSPEVALKTLSQKK